MKLNNKELQELENLLSNWFNSIDLSARNIFNQNKIAKLIKSNLVKSNNWKDKPRGSHKGNSTDLLNKGKQTKKEMVSKIKELENLLVCKCGRRFERKDDGKLICSFLFCEY